MSLTEDKHVNKGPNRPVFNQMQRARAIAALQIVDHVVINNSADAINLIKSIQPNLYSKGSDYKILSSDVTGMIKKEIDAVKSVGGDIYFAQTPLSSSTKIMNSLENLMSSSIFASNSVQSSSHNKFMKHSMASQSFLLS